MSSLAVESARFFESFQRWAMERVFAAARSAGPATEAGALHGSKGGGTIHGLLGHIVDVDIFWLSRWLGNEHAAFQMPGAWPAISDIEDAWRADLSRRSTFFANLDEAELAREYGFYRGDPPTYDRQLIWKTVLHAHNHATHHRAEVSALLTAAGFPPASIDMLAYLRGM